MSGLQNRMNTPGKLVLEGELSIFEAGHAKDLLLETLAAHDALQVDLSGITEFDTAGVQVLLVIQREAEQAGKTLKWTGHSQRVAQVLDLLNLGATLGAPGAIVWS